MAPGRRLPRSLDIAASRIHGADVGALHAEPLFPALSGPKMGAEGRVAEAPASSEGAVCGHLGGSADKGSALFERLHAAMAKGANAGGQSSATQGGGQGAAFRDLKQRGYVSETKRGEGTSSVDKLKAVQAICVHESPRTGPDSS